MLGKDIRMLFHCNKKTIFKSVYEFDRSFLTFEGSSYSPIFVPWDANDKDVRKIAGLEKWFIEVRIDTKKEKHVMTAYPKTDDDKSTLSCTIGLKEASFNRLEANLVNNGMDFLTNIKFQISVSTKGFKKKDAGAGGTYLDVTESSVIFASKWDDQDD